MIDPIHPVHDDVVLQQWWRRRSHRGADLLAKAMLPRRMSFQLQFQTKCQEFSASATMREKESSMNNSPFFHNKICNDE